MSTIILQSDSEEKLQSVMEYAKKQGVIFQRLHASTAETDKVAAILRGGDGQSIPDPTVWQNETREDRF